MNKEKVTANERSLKAFEKPPVSRRQNVCKLPGERRLLGRIRLERRPEAVGQQRLDSAYTTPGRDGFGILQKILEQDFVVALQKNCLMALTALDQQIEHFLGVRSPVDIVPQKNLYRAGYGIRIQIGIDSGEQPGQQIGASVHVADSIQARTLRDLGRPEWLRLFSAPGR